LPRSFVFVVRRRPDPPSRERAHFASVANGGEKALHPAGLGKAVMLGGGGRFKAAGGRG
jgi:hypothetical protein